MYKFSGCLRVPIDNDGIDELLDGKWEIVAQASTPEDGKREMAKRFGFYRALVLKKDNGTYFIMGVGGN